MLVLIWVQDRRWAYAAANYVIVNFAISLNLDNILPIYTHIFQDRDTYIIHSASVPSKNFVVVLKRRTHVPGGCRSWL